MAAIYKICPVALWREAEDARGFAGAPGGTVDGYIHFSTPPPGPETPARPFPGETDLVLVAVDPDRLGPSLRWEPSRGGDLFPHLYDRLLLDAVLWVKPLRLGADGRHVLPELGE